MMSHVIWVLNGPNLNLLGEREPQIYGHTTLADIEGQCRALATACGVTLEFRQTNHEGVLVDWIQAARGASALVINPAGLSFQSIPVFDALKTVTAPIYEVHISNIHARDELHRHSIQSRVATAVICGLGPYGYIVALQAALQRLGALPTSFPPALRTPS